MKKTLSEITGDALAIYTDVDELEGELTEEMEKLLKINEGEIQSKSIAYKEIIGSSKSLILRAEEEKKRIDAIIKSEQRKVDYLEYNLLQAVKVYGNIEIGLTTITACKSESIQVEDINSLPREFKVIKVTESADKKKLKKAIKSGVEIDGVTLVEKKNLRIK